MLIIGGFDEREKIGFDVCRASITRRTEEPVEVVALIEENLRERELYTRPHERRGNQTWDVISNAPMSTSFANSRFLSFELAKGRAKWALYCDFSDMIFLADVAKLFELADDRYAVMCVQHDYVVRDAVKMDEQQNVRYFRKNWSSLFLLNTEHPANARLTVEKVNTLAGRELHSFAWLTDTEIGALPPAWNYLVSIQPETTPVYCIHYTQGAPFMPGYESGPYADIWWAERKAAGL